MTQCDHEIKIGAKIPIYIHEFFLGNYDIIITFKLHDIFEYQLRNCIKSFFEEIKILITYNMYKINIFGICEEIFFIILK